MTILSIKYQITVIANSTKTKEINLMIVICANNFSHKAQFTHLVLVISKNGSHRKNIQLISNLILWDLCKVWFTASDFFPQSSPFQEVPIAYWTRSDAYSPPNGKSSMKSEILIKEAGPIDFALLNCKSFGWEMSPAYQCKELLQNKSHWYEGFFSGWTRLELSPLSWLLPISNLDCQLFKMAQ